jgi:hypothetical protein
MAIEYHKIIKAFDDKNHFQIYVFRYDRDVEDQSLGLIDIWVLTKFGSCESKVRIDMHKVGERAYHNPDEQMTEKQVDDLYKYFDNIIDNTARSQRVLEKLENEVEDTITSETQRLLDAAESALSAHPINQSIDEIVENLLQNETKNNQHNKS